MTQLHIDTAALVANWQLLKGMVAGETAAVVKADGYGLGIANVAPPLARAGCRTFFVAHMSEGIALRRLLPDVRIIILHGVKAGEVALFKQHNLTPVIAGPADLTCWPAGGWLHVDTGMSRLGFPPHELPEGSFDGIMSHFACSDEPQHFMNVEQLKTFRAVRAKYPGVPASLSNSSGIFLGAANHFELVRPGVALYGVNPTPDAPNPMQRVVTLTATVLQTRTIAAGSTVGYGAGWMADRETKLATIECGYADGLKRAMSGRGFAVIHDTKVPFAGRVSMDLIVLDVTDTPPVAVGDKVELIGTHLSVDDVAATADTIGYEVLTSLRLARSSL